MTTVMPHTIELDVRAILHNTVAWVWSIVLIASTAVYSLPLGMSLIKLSGHVFGNVRATLIE